MRTDRCLLARTGAINGHGDGDDHEDDDGDDHAGDHDEDHDEDHDNYTVKPGKRSNVTRPT